MLHFCEFLLIFLITCQLRSKIGKFGKKLEFSALFGMEHQKISKNSQKSENATSN